jgi:hypothetical protein
VQLVYPGVRDADMGWADALRDMEEARRDPVARYLEIEKLHELGMGEGGQFRWTATPTGAKLLARLPEPPCEDVGGPLARFKR